MQKIERVATWKRLNRTEMGTDVDMEDIGEKRRGDSKDDQSELLKKRKVS